MTSGMGRFAWAVTVILLVISLMEFSEGDFASGVGLLVAFVVLSAVLLRLKASWQPRKITAVR